MTHQVLALKWRPRDFHEVVGQPHVVKALTNGLDNNRLHHAFLFTGTRGVGKTTLARIFAKSLNCERGVSSEPCGECSICQEVDQGNFVDLIEIDAASRTKVEDTREILDNVQYAPTRGRYKIYLIDEVHMLSNSSFNALLKTLEEPPAHVKFLLATTDPQKLPVTVLSRCLRLQLKKIDVPTIEKQLTLILKAEDVAFEPQAVTLIAQAGEGSMRDALSILDQAIAYTNSNITVAAIRDMLGLIDDQHINHLLNALATRNTNEVLAVSQRLEAFGLDYHALLEDLITAFHRLTLLQINPDMMAYDIEDRELYLALKDQFSAEDLQLFYQVALHGRRDLHLHPNAGLGFEMTLLRMLLFSPLSERHMKAVQAKADSAESAKKKVTPIAPSSDSSQPSQNIEVIEDAPSPIQKNAPVPLTPRKKAEIEQFAAELSDPMKRLEETALENVDNTDNVPSWDLPPVESYDQQEAVQDSWIEPEKIDVPKEDESSKEDEVIVETSETIEESSEESIDEAPSNEEISSESPKTITSAMLTNNDAWLQMVSELQLESVLRGIASTLAFEHFENGVLKLQRAEQDRVFNVNEAGMRLSMAISNYLGEKVRCELEYVKHASELEEETLYERTDRINAEKYEEVKEAFSRDPIVRYIVDECQGKLFEKTIKVTE
ncbi:DNA polymerase III subunit gamma/tau [Ignatzschineria sp. RMDPL8A]|uniref:DNA polymerase III subunit gamma/tau n=1 Tax=Ignatzschineria sp. RMDPL8A TaxID=2999236 RepID=UPI0024466376|nr:DNA polymerase III subunit gamma/tau [Ignatzschineria sp. RMDPL8A]MDG9730082.1 DNA polymerase III subunit gamma/tau [Ignatzschineria sp. RMDPL8A]